MDFTFRAFSFDILNRYEEFDCFKHPSIDFIVDNDIQVRMSVTTQQLEIIHPRGTHSSSPQLALLPIKVLSPMLPALQSVLLHHLLSLEIPHLSEPFLGAILVEPTGFESFVQDLMEVVLVTEVCLKVKCYLEVVKRARPVGIF